MGTTQQDQTAEVTTNGTLSYESVRDAVRDWPLALRAALMHDIVNTLTEQAEERQERRRKALSEMLGLLKTDKPAPSDEEVERWLDERRMEKYG